MRVRAHPPTAINTRPAVHLLRVRSSKVTGTQLVGYGIAFAGVMYYNYQKVEQMKAQSAAAQKAPEKQPLLTQEEGQATTKGSE